MSALQNRFIQLISSYDDKKKGSWALGHTPTPSSANNLTTDITNLIFEEAILQRASDIHIEPKEKKMRIRYRIDGRLYEALVIDDNPNVTIMSRIKIMANLSTDTMSQRKPQDGRFSYRVGAESFDFRVSTFPTIQGEKIALRVLNKDFGLLDLEKIGIDQTDLGRLKQILQRKNGLLLVSGPTGSGKTTTLYAMLNTLRSNNTNIVTLEDPVEYQIDDLNQCDIKSKADYDFASGLKAILRQDPDIILVGEIREIETAEIAMRGSMTGHLVLSSVHANNAIGTVVRLLNMGLERYMVSYALVGTIAQRLVRRICEHCRISYAVPGEYLKRLQLQCGIDLSTFSQSSHEGGLQYISSDQQTVDQKVYFYKGQGCEHCNQTGYRGRIGIFEIVIFDEKLRDGILRGATASELKDIAVSSGTKPLAIDGLQKAKKGLTTLEEIYSVLIEQ